MLRSEDGFHSSLSLRSPTCYSKFPHLSLIFLTHFTHFLTSLLKLLTHFAHLSTLLLKYSTFSQISSNFSYSICVLTFLLVFLPNFQISSHSITNFSNPVYNFFFTSLFMFVICFTQFFIFYLIFLTYLHNFLTFSLKFLFIFLTRNIYLSQILLCVLIYFSFPHFFPMLLSVTHLPFVSLLPPHFSLIFSYVLSRIHFICYSCS